MTELAGKTVYKFRSDQTGQIQYTFNSLGFRSPEITNSASLFTVGNSITFGIGVDIKDTYGYQLSQRLNLPWANVANGGYLHENHQQIPTIDQIAARNNNKDIVIIQINNLSRRIINGKPEVFYDPAWCVDRFLQYFEYVESAFADLQHYYVYWDDRHFDIPIEIQQRLSIHNKFCLDYSLQSRLAFGAKSHCAIAKTLFNIIESQRAQSV